MIERILAPLDGSLTAEAVLPHVRRLARTCGAEIVLVQAVPVIGVEGGESIFQAAVQAGTQYLAAMKDRLESAGFRARVIIRVGGPAETILGVAAETHVNLIAVATHGRTGVPRLVLGSIAERLLRSTPVPVLAVRPFWTYELQPPGGVEAQPIRNILIPVGSGGLSLCVLPHAVEMARLLGARVHVLHVQVPAEEEASMVLADVVARFRREGIDTETLVQQGDPVDRILAVCRSGAMDLAILSTHGRSGLSRLVLGSVTEEVLRQARVPLMVVRGDPAAKPAWRMAGAPGVAQG